MTDPAGELRLAIAQWDGKSASAIKAVYDRFHDRERFNDDLIALMENETSQAGATWLLKHHCETKHVELSEEQRRSYQAKWKNLSHWEAQLHVLQCMEYIPIDASQKANVHSFLQRCLASEKKFVRAWAYSGSARLALAIPDYRSETHALLVEAHEKESAGSVRVRVRKGLELLDRAK